MTVSADNAKPKRKANASRSFCRDTGRGFESHQLLLLQPGGNPNRLTLSSTAARRFSLARPLQSSTRLQPAGAYTAPSSLTVRKSYTPFGDMMQMEERKGRLDTADEDTESKNELLLDLVMPYLSTRDCVRTSILSSSWRYRWTTVPILVFDNNCCPLSYKGNTSEEAQALASIINRCLILHTGSIQVFQVKDVCVVPEIDSWILRVCKGSIQTFGLELCDLNHYKLPSSVYTCENLINLNLANCDLRPPSYFEGFKNLKRLSLEYVTMTEDTFENLISSCPLLEDLTFIDAGLNNIKINARNLKFLYIRGEFKSITFGHTPSRLLVISLALDGIDFVYGETSLAEFLTNHPSIRRFELGCGFLRFFTARSMLERLAFQCKDLYYVKVDINLFSADQCLAILSMFRSSPNLTELKLQHWASGVEATGVWADRSKCHLVFQRLRSVTMDRFYGNSAELDFLKFVLESSPVLENLIIIPCSDDTTRGVVKSIYGFKRASVGAEIIFDNIGFRSVENQLASA